MIETQERMTNEVTDSVQGVDDATAPVEGTTADAPEKTTAAVAGLVGALTGGFMIAAAAGFVLGFALGVAVARRATPAPPPRWQVWR